MDCETLSHERFLKKWRGGCTFIFKAWNESARIASLVRSLVRTQKFSFKMRFKNAPSERKNSVTTMNQEKTRKTVSFAPQFFGTIREGQSKKKWREQLKKTSQRTNRFGKRHIDSQKVPEEHEKGISWGEGGERAHIPRYVTWEHSSYT